MEFEIKEKEFKHISSLVYDSYGINLHVGKKELVRARLSKRLRTLGLTNFKEYIDYMERDSTKVEFTNMIDLLSTNLTNFFREDDHFKFLKKTLIPEWSNGINSRSIRIWSAGCSSGEEPYTIAIVIRRAMDILKGKDIKILATDISTRMLEVARNGIYSEDRLKTIPKDMRRKFFLKGNGESSNNYSVRKELREMVKLGRLNLLDEWPMKGQFELIFCRNVMIYFDKPTQGKLINRFWNILKPGGILMVGHSESLTGIQHSFKYIQPTVYRKI